MAPPPVSIPLTIPAGTPLKIALDKEVRIRSAGQPVHGKVVEPVFAFDKLVIPAGTEVNGKVAEIEAVAKKRRTIAAMNADFSPHRQVRVDFDELLLADGRRLPLKTSVSPGSGAVLQFVPAPTEKRDGLKDAGKNLVSRNTWMLVKALTPISSSHSISGPNRSGQKRWLHSELRLLPEV